MSLNIFWALIYFPTQDSRDSSYTFSAWTLESLVSPGSPGCFEWGMVSRNPDLDAIGVSNFQALARNRPKKQTYTSISMSMYILKTINSYCTQTFIYIQISMFISIFIFALKTINSYCIQFQSNNKGFFKAYPLHICMSSPKARNWFPTSSK